MIDYYKKKYSSHHLTIIHLPDGNSVNDYWDVKFFEIYDCNWKFDRPYEIRLPVPYIHYGTFKGEVVEMNGEKTEIWLDGEFSFIENFLL